MEGFIYNKSSYMELAWQTMHQRFSDLSLEPKLYRICRVVDHSVQIKNCIYNLNVTEVIMLT